MNAEMIAVVVSIVGIGGYFAVEMRKSERRAAQQREDDLKQRQKEREDDLKQRQKEREDDRKERQARDQIVDAKFDQIAKAHAGFRADLANLTGRFDEFTDMFHKRFGSGADVKKQGAD